MGSGPANPILTDWGIAKAVSSGSTLTINNVVAATGDDVIVCVAYEINSGEAMSSVKWGSGLTLTLDVSKTQTIGNHVLEVYRGRVASGGTQNVVATWDLNLTSRVMTVVTVKGDAATPLDKTKSAANTSTSPSSGASVTRTTARQLLIGAVSTEGGPADSAGSWSNSFTALQRDGVTGGSINLTLSTAYRIVTATGTEAAAKTGITSRPWVAVLCTYKCAVDWTTDECEDDDTPVAINQTIMINATENDDTPVAIKPTIMVNACENDDTPGAMNQTIVANAVNIEDAVQDADHPVGIDVQDSFQQSNSTVSAIGGPLRASTPANLGDGNPATIVSFGPFFSPGTSSMIATALQPVSNPGTTIDYIIIGVQGKLHSGTVSGRVPLLEYVQRFRLKLGANVVTQAYSGTPFSTAIQRTQNSGQFLTKPGGGAWTWNDVMALAEIGIECDYAPGGSEYFQVDLAEVWVEVYGPIGAVGRSVQIIGSGTLGNVASSGQLGNISSSGQMGLSEQRIGTTTGPVRG